MISPLKPDTKVNPHKIEDDSDPSQSNGHEPIKTSKNDILCNEPSAEESEYKTSATKVLKNAEAFRNINLKNEKSVNLDEVLPDKMVVDVDAVPDNPMMR